ncbi:hypothetical protein [Kribbella sp. NPDC051718]|uniref:hypothetical protein n=1 Tax=Kribbella sp. NPDC051718 TaxID=3155168 RepID=UPI00343C4388
MSKFLGFLLGIAVALVGPAMFGVLAADGGIKLNAKEMALAYGIGALIFWAVVSYFSGAAALGAALTFGAMIYTVHWIPNRMTNFLNDVPGVTSGMIDGVKQYTGNGVVPILAVISLVFGIQSIVRSVQRRRRERVEAERRQREQEAAVQAQQMPQPPQPVGGYPVAGGDYQPDDRFGNNFGNSNYDDLFEEEPAPFTPRNQADEQTAQFPRSEPPTEYDDTRLVPTDADETVMVPTGNQPVADSYDEDPEPDAEEAPDEAPTQQVLAEAAMQQVAAEEAATQHVAAEEPAEAATQHVPMEAPAATAQPVASEAATQQVPVEERPAAPAAAAAPRVSAEEPAAAPVASEAATQQVAVDEPAATPADAATQQVPVEEWSAAPAEAATQQVPVEEPAAADEPVASEGARGEETVAQPVPVPEPEAGRPVAPRVAGGAVAAAPQVGGSQGGGSQDDGGEATQPMPVARPEAPKASLRKEEMGQQYRERMDPPDVDDTGEFFIGAFENPPEQTTQRMELPGQFRS